MLAAFSRRSFWSGTIDGNLLRKHSKFNIQSAGTQIPSRAISGVSGNMTGMIQDRGKRQCNGAKDHGNSQTRKGSQKDPRTV